METSELCFIYSRKINFGRSILHEEKKTFPFAIRQTRQIQTYGGGIQAIG